MWRGYSADEPSFIYICIQKYTSLHKKGSLYDLFILTFSRLSQLETEFDKQLAKEENWFTSLSYMRDLYSDFVHSTHSLAHNFVCASCGVTGHDPIFYYMHRMNDVSLHVLSISQDTYVPFVD